jgi:D-inositol-3-phosphate glycosyltransferase
MNVYVLETARELARRGIDVDIFARATAAGVFDIELEPGLRVRQIEAGGLALSLMREPASFDVIHSHYWVSGQIGLFAKERPIPGLGLNPDPWSCSGRKCLVAAE